MSTPAMTGAVMVIGGGISGMQAALDLADSGFFVYLVEKTGAIGGLKLPPGLVESQQLPEPIFTPSTKAELGTHDENISAAQMAATAAGESARIVSAIPVSAV